MCRPLASPERYHVDLSLSLEALRANLHKKWRYNLKRSERHGLAIEWLDDDRGIQQFLGLYGLMRDRKAFADESGIEQWPRFQRDLPPRLAPRIALCLHEGEPLAGVVVSAIGDTALYAFGASHPRALKLGAGYFVQWAVIKWLEERGLRWYDLGGDLGNAGLRQFKSGLAGRSTGAAAFAGDFELCRDVPSRVFISMGLALRRRLTAARRAVAPG